jgi:hypothetical protein
MVYTAAGEYGMDRRQQRLQRCVIEALERRNMLSGASLSTATNYAENGAAGSVVVVDVNGDGNQDIVTANTNGTVSIFLGNGDGTFQPAVTISDGLPAGKTTSIVAISTGYYGNYSLVVADGTKQMSILPGNGDGTFGSPELLDTSGKVEAIATADFNNDGYSDLLVAEDNGSSSSVVELLGNGDGTFQPGQTIFKDSSDQTLSLATGDFNDDGNTDVAIGDGDKVAVLLGNGDGTFYSGGSVVVTGTVRSIIDADVNNDGEDDLVVGTSTGITVLLGNGDGTFSTSATISGQYTAIAVGDIDGDGNLDLIVGTSSNGYYAVQVLPGNGDGTFGTTPEAVTPTLAAPTALAVADVNGDGMPDVVVAGANGQMSVVLNSGASPYSYSNSGNYYGGGTYGGTCLGGYTGGGYAPITFNPGGPMMPVAPIVTINPYPVGISSGGDAKLQGNVVFGDFQSLTQNFGTAGAGLTSGEIASLDSFASQFGVSLVLNPSVSTIPSATPTATVPGDTNQAAQNDIRPVTADPQVRLLSGTKASSPAPNVQKPDARATPPGASSGILQSTDLEATTSILSDTAGELFSNDFLAPLV